MKKTKVEKEYNKIKDTKAITLIALVITIIVLLILAGVSVATLTGENGILSQATAAKERTEIEEIKEKIRLDILAAQAENKGQIAEEQIEEILSKYGVVSVEGEEKVLTIGKGQVIKISDICTGVLNGDTGYDGIIEVPEEYVESYDVSANGDESIKLYLVPIEGETDKYELLIIGQGKMKHNGYYDDREYSKYAEKIISAKISKGIENIAFETFVGCSNLTSVKIPNTVTEIGTNVFRECTSLTSIEIPNSVTTIRFKTFEGCTNLSNISIPKSVTNIEWGVFVDTPWLEAKREESPFVVVNNILVDAETATGDIIIPNSVTKIPASMLSSRTDITSIEIPDSVTEIGASAFSSCEQLTYIKLPSNIKIIEESLFSFCENLESITIPNSVTSIGKSAFSWCKKLKSITIPNGIKTIEEEVFYYCENLESITIPNSVTSINERAFGGCTSLSSINIPKSVTNIGEYVFLWWNEEQTINCEVESKLSGWDEKWDAYNSTTARKAKLNWEVSM